MVEVAVLLGAEETQAKVELEKVRDFEMRLANISAAKSERRNKTKLYNPTTLGEFPSDAGFPESWTNYVQKIFDFGDDKLDIEDSERVIIYDPNFYKNLSSVLQSTDKRTLANYAAWRMASSTMKYLTSEARDIRQKYSKALTGTYLLITSYVLGVLTSLIHHYDCGGGAWRRHKPCNGLMSHY